MKFVWTEQDDAEVQLDLSQLVAENLSMGLRRLERETDSLPLYNAEYL